MKIDRSFASGPGEDPGDGVLVYGMIGMASGLSVVADGVETQGRVELPRRMGCRPTANPNSVEVDGLPAVTIRREGGWTSADLRPKPGPRKRAGLRRS